MQLNVKAASTYYNRGGARYLKGDFEGAIAAQTQALKLDSGFANAYGDRAQPGIHGGVRGPAEPQTLR